MTAPPVYPRGDQYPPFGDWVTIRGTISSSYLERGQQMIVRWSPFWESMTEAGYVRPVDEALNPDVEARFPNVGDVLRMIAEGASTLPGEMILGVRATETGLAVRVGVDEASSHEHEVDWPVMTTLVEAVQDLRDETEGYATDARTHLDAGVADLRDDLVTYNAIASAAAEVALDAAEGKAGNTGWVEATLDASASGQVLLRRRGSDVDVRLVEVGTTVERSSPTVVATLPSGFRPAARTTAEVSASASVEDVYRVAAEGDSLLVVGGATGTWPVSALLVGYVSWVTDEPWPVA